MPKKIVEAKVIGQHVLNNSTKLIEVYAPELAELAVPGQFVNVQVFNCTAPLLRRPFGVAAVNKKRRHHYHDLPHYRRSYQTAGRILQRR